MKISVFQLAICNKILFSQQIIMEIHKLMGKIQNNPIYTRDFTDALHLGPDARPDIISIYWQEAISA